MAARARDGLSSSAREEWTRLERGEKASPKEGSHVTEVPIAGGADESGLDIEQSVYWSPMKSFADEAGVQEDKDEEGVAELLVHRSAFVEVGQGSPGNGGIRSVLRAEEEPAGESSVVEHDDGRRAFLSPITEVVSPLSSLTLSWTFPLTFAALDRARVECQYALRPSRCACSLAGSAAGSAFLRLRPPLFALVRLDLDSRCGASGHPFPHPFHGSPRARHPSIRLQDPSPAQPYHTFAEPLPPPARPLRRQQRRRR